LLAVCLAAYRHPLSVLTKDFLAILILANDPIHFLLFRIEIAAQGGNTCLQNLTLPREFAALRLNLQFPSQSLSRLSGFLRLSGRSG